jgi:hypothetical protein
MNLYITTKYNKKVEIYSRPEEDFGYDYETFSSCDNIGDLYWNHTDSGLVNIDVMIEHLKELKEKGSNYVGCEWHCDHGEMELFGFTITKSSEEEIQKFLDDKKSKERKKKEEEIRLLESKVENLKKSLVD